MRTTTLGAVSACLVAAGCASNDIGSTEYDEIAQLVASSVATPDGGGIAGGAADAARLARGEMPPGFAMDPQTGMATGSHHGISCVYMVFCTDAQGTHMDRCGPAAATATVVGAWQGTLALDTFAGVIDRQATWTLTDMASGRATLAGQSQLVYDVTFAPGFVHAHAAATEDAALAVDLATGAVTSGTLSSQLRVHRTVDASHGQQIWDHDIGAEVTFAGAGTATLVLDGTRTYTIDLATGAVSADRVYSNVAITGQ